MKNFLEWNRLFADQRLDMFNTDSSGVVWLKLKSIIRKGILSDFILKNNIEIEENKAAFEALYKRYMDGLLLPETIDNFLVEYNQAQIQEVEAEFDIVKAELYKLQSFSWGGDATNSLDKQIVSYIKYCWSYDEICGKIDNEIAGNTKRYTLNSWYNNWSAILTEHLFKSHPKTISAIGKVKSVDFFIDNTPLDLKITYFPKEYLKQQRRIAGFDVELTALKKLAKRHDVTFDKNSAEELLKYQITEQLKDLHKPDVDNELNRLWNENNTIIQTVINNKSRLIKWLYEQQGEMRFGAENRLFLILIDCKNLTESWKLKRNFDLLKPKVKAYLDGFSATNLEVVNFQFKNKSYTSLADALFIAV
ncbi:MAG: hypothetical protein LBR70_02825 [Lactobacillaceae bacterium]|jgi:hypothetical protein|nr:hypothetical protein [Lactobacillaceae bacterium]